MCVQGTGWVSVWWFKTPTIVGSSCFSYVSKGLSRGDQPVSYKPCLLTFQTMTQSATNLPRCQQVKGRQLFSWGNQLFSQSSVTSHPLPPRQTQSQTSGSKQQSQAWKSWWLMPAPCFPVLGQSVIDLVLEGWEKVSVCRAMVWGQWQAMAPPSSAVATEAVNQEMGTTPAWLSVTFCPLHCRYVWSRRAWAIERHAHLNPDRQ